MSHSNTPNTAGNKKDGGSTRKVEDGLVRARNEVGGKKISLGEMDEIGQWRSADISRMPKRDKIDVLKDIETIMAERIPKERDMSLGRKVWLNDQRKRIAELEKLLH